MVGNYNRGSDPLSIVKLLDEGKAYLEHDSPNIKSVNIDNTIRIF